MDFRKLAKGLLWTALFLGIVGGLLRAFVLNIWTIPSDDPLMSASLAPSLAPGDVVLVLHMKQPSFGELARCLDPDEPRRFVVGRIAAEGGDTLELISGRLVINGTSAGIPHGCKEKTVTVDDPNTGSPVELNCDIEELGSVAHKRANRVMEGMSAPEPLKRAVQSGFVFLVSDNRFYPSDSRVYGAVPIETCDSRVIFRIWSAKGFADEPNRFTWIN